MNKMQYEIRTVKSNDGDSVEWQETGFSLCTEPFPPLVNSKAGDIFRVYYEYGCGIGYPVDHVEKINKDIN